MRLVRNIDPEGLCKYAAVRLDKLHGLTVQDQAKVKEALAVLERAGLVEYGRAGEQEEFFLIKLKDRNAGPALLAYAIEARKTDPEFADDVYALCDRAGVNSAWCKQPDTMQAQPGAIDKGHEP